MIDLSKEWEEASPIGMDIQTEWKMPLPLLLKRSLHHLWVVLVIPWRNAVRISHKNGRQNHHPIEPGPETPIESFTGSLGRIFRTAGQVAGGFNDVVGEGLKTGYRNLVPEDVRDSSNERNTALMMALMLLPSEREP